MIVLQLGSDYEGQDLCRGGIPQHKIYDMI